MYVDLHVIAKNSNIFAGLAEIFLGIKIYAMVFH